MKKLICILPVLLFIISCKKQTKPKVDEAIKTVSIIEKIANAHGFENWNDVSEISFTFNDKRNWTWKPKSNEVTLISENDTIHYNRNKLDSLNLKADKAFINDKFWLLIPFQLIWDKTANISSDSSKQQAPISAIELNKITISYPDEGGYTPGDAYDIYFDDKFIIREWVFRKANKTQPTLSNTFEDYKNFNGLLLALSHKKKSADWNLTFNDVKVLLEK